MPSCKIFALDNLCSGFSYAVRFYSFLFKEDLHLAGYAERSIQSYTSAVLKLQRFYNKPLEDISEEQLRQYWLCCQSEFGWSAATLRISYSGIQHFFRKTLVSRVTRN
jgi:hypothetical protein